MKIEDRGYPSFTLEFIPSVLWSHNVYHQRLR